jgi:hypothetical protein
MTAALSSTIFGQESIAADDTRTASIQAAVTQAESLLSHFGKEKGTGQKRLENLEEIIKRAVRLAWLLFSQPAGFSADWSDGGGGVVVFPGLVQISDENGKALVRRRTLGEMKEVAAL